jgi:hypothetical protein
MRHSTEDCELRGESPSSQHNSLRNHLERVFKVTELDFARHFNLCDDLDDLPGMPNPTFVQDQNLNATQLLVSPSAETRKQDILQLTKISVSPRSKRRPTIDFRDPECSEGEFIGQPTIQLKSLRPLNEPGLKLPHSDKVNQKHLISINNDTRQPRKAKSLNEALATDPVISQLPQQSPGCTPQVHNSTGQLSDVFAADYLGESGLCVKLPLICSVLSKVFNQNCVSVEEYTHLSNFEEKLLNSVLQRKFLKCLQPAELLLKVDEKVQLINTIIRMKSKKRHEESYKFVLTRTLKYLKRKIELPSTSCDSELFLYEHYFGQTARDLGLSLGEFHYPLTGAKSKRFNFKYFALIFQSKPFVEQMTDFVNNSLNQQYHLEIDRKLFALVCRWDKMLQESGDRLSSVEKSINEYLLSNKRCKLPWTAHEVSEATLKFRKLLARFSTTQ